MLRKAFYPIALLGLSLFVSRAAADDAALINALVHKGILSQKDADSIEAEVKNEASQAAENSPNSPNSLIKIGDWVKELDLYGDLRIRNYYQQNQLQLPAPPTVKNYDSIVQRDRWRFRLRLNADF